MSELPPGGVDAIQDDYLMDLGQELAGGPPADLGAAGRRLRLFEKSAERDEAIKDLITADYEQRRAAGRAPTLGECWGALGRVVFNEQVPTLFDLMPGCKNLPRPGECVGEPYQGRGRYELAEVKGIGGMGVVFRAKDRKLSSDVAVKVLQWHEDPSVAKKAAILFERERRGGVPLDPLGVWTPRVPGAGTL